MTKPRFYIDHTPISPNQALPHSVQRIIDHLDRMEFGRLLTTRDLVSELKIGLYAFQSYSGHDAFQDYKEWHGGYRKTFLLWGSKKTIEAWRMEKNKKAEED